ncbi:DUF2975 domain-containing protein [Yinghuangia soli]|uniref:DUF2975 domain-containing protein n=1 Tax=Yinghuangia soli TaxID=2908204 RepID=A0AA41Q472_9ACTN|nr:DUF2975 domain-containing protein [Yinghuangia soli]MCF2530391.1 DUF2975 domain-containing protein [Yinghuangia soli]
MSVAQWQRVDSKTLEILLAAIGVVVLVVGMAMPLLGIVGIIDPVITSRAVPLGGGGDGADILRQGSFALTEGSTGELSFADPSFKERVMLALPRLVSAGLALAVVYLLLRVVRTLKAGDPFVPANARRVTAISALVIAFGTLDPIVESLTTGSLIGNSGAQYLIDTGVTFTWPPILIGILVAALSEVFRRGTRLRADVEGLV